MYYYPSGADASGEIAGSKKRITSAFGCVDGSAKKRLATGHRILVPVDGSERSTQAIAHVIRHWNDAHSAEVHLVNVQPLVMQGDFALDMAVQIERRMRLAAAQEVLGSARGLLDAVGIPCKTTALFGHPARAIAHHAREHGFDAIVMGTRGLGSLNGLLRRSVAVEVVARSDVPVTLVKPVVSRHPKSKEALRNVRTPANHYRVRSEPIEESAA